MSRYYLVRKLKTYKNQTNRSYLWLHFTLKLTIPGDVKNCLLLHALDLKIYELSPQSFALFHTICLHETSKYEIIFVFLLFLDKVINILDKNNYLSKSFSESIHLQYYDMYNKIRAKNIVRIKINMITFTN